MLWQFLIFFSISTLISASVYYYAARITMAAFPNMQRAQTAIRYIFIAFFAALLLQFVGWNIAEFPLANPVTAWLAYSGFGFITVLATFYLLRDLPLWLLQRVSKNSALLELPGRLRKPLVTHLILVGVFFLTLYGLYEARREPDVRVVEVQVENLKPELDGLRIVQLSDIHVGPTVRRSKVAEIVDVVNALEPQLVAITGDLIDGSVEKLSEHVEPLRDLRPEYGTYFVTGNHEYFFNTEQWLIKLQQLGMRILLNNFRIITPGGSSILVGGVTDYHAERYRPEHKGDLAAASGKNREVDLRILLAHQPRSILEVEKGLFDLIMVGHTHGGQYFPATYLVRLFQPFLPGLQRYNDSWLYVNRGAGYWGPPIRIGSPAEITCFKLIRVEK